MMKFIHRTILLTVAIGFLFAPLHGQRTVIKMGTLAPEGTAWHDVLLQMKQDWSRLSDGKVVLRIYANGALGDEYTMIRKMRIGQLQAVALSGNGLSRIDPSISCLQIPLMFESYAELDYVREKMAPILEGNLEEKGFKVLSWADAGWVHFFTTRPAPTLDDIRGMKLLTSAGDPQTEELYKDFGFRVVPLPYTEVLTALQTGMIEAVQGPPLFAMVQQWFGLAQNMTDIKWAPLIAATVIQQEAFDRIPAQLRAQLLESGQRAGRQLLQDIRSLNEEAIPAMTKRGLNRVQIDSQAADLWRSEAIQAYPKLRGRYVSEELFDEVLRLRDEFRRKSDSQAPE